MSGELQEMLWARHKEKLTLYPFLACEALDLVMQVATDPAVKPMVSRVNREIFVQEFRKNIRNSLENMDSSVRARPGLSGPLFFEKQPGFLGQHVIHRPVIIVLVSNGVVRPMSIQLQEHAVNKGSATQKSIDEMMLDGKVIKEGNAYFRIIPVVYTSLTVNQLTNFNPERKTFDMHYKITLTWPQDVYSQLCRRPNPKEECKLNVESVDLFEPEILSKSPDIVTENTNRPYPAYSNTQRSHSYMCYERKASCTMQNGVTVVSL